MNLDPDPARDPRLPRVPRLAARRRGGKRARLHGLRAGLPSSRRHPGPARRRSPPELTPGVFDDTALDDPTALASIDPVLRDVASWGAEVRRVDGLRPPRRCRRLSARDRPRAVIAGGVDGRLFRAVLEPVCPVPFVAWPHPGLPGWAGPLDLVVMMSVDGSDEDALMLVAEAVRRGCSLLVAGSARLCSRGRGGEPRHDAAPRHDRRRHRTRSAGPAGPAPARLGSRGRGRTGGQRTGRRGRALRGRRILST